MEDEREFALTTDNPVVDVGTSKRGDKLTATFTIKNKSTAPISIGNIRIPCDCTVGNVEKSNLAAGESTTVTMEVDTKHLMGHTVKSIYLKINGSEEELRLYISTEVEE